MSVVTGCNSAGRLIGAGTQLKPEKKSESKHHLHFQKTVLDPDYFYYCYYMVIVIGSTLLCCYCHYSFNPLKKLCLFSLAAM